MRRLSLVFVFVSACTHCSTRGQPDNDASVDGAIEAEPKKDAAADTGALPPGCDGGIASDWPGWRRLVELDACCPVDIPLDVTASVPAFKWTPCQTGRPNCEQVDNIKYTSANGGLLLGADGSRDGELLRLALAPEGNISAESRVYRRVSGAPVAAWRMREGPCIVGSVFGDTTLAVFADTPTANPYAVRTHIATGDAQILMSKPVFHFIMELGPVDTPEGTSASDTTIVFDQQPRGRFVRVKAGTASYAMTAPPPQLVNPYVHGNAVFGRDQRGNMGWSQYWRMNPDGTLTLFRAKPQTHITALTSDKDTLYWAESWGGVNIDPNDQPHVEIWMAPFTDDPATLASTATLLVKLDGQMRRPGEMMAMNGYVGLGESLSAFVIRKQDGAVKLVPPFNGDQVWLPVYVSQTEVWALVHLPNDPANVLSKIGLGVW